MRRELIFMVNLFFLFIDSMGLNWQVAECFGPDPAELITAGLTLSVWAVRLESFLITLLNHLAPGGLRLKKNWVIFLFCNRYWCKLHILKRTVAYKLYGDKTRGGANIRIVFCGYSVYRFGYSSVMLRAKIQHFILLKYRISIEKMSMWKTKVLSQSMLIAAWI